jgi:mono/diheme cytochrome c family protein
MRKFIVWAGMGLFLAVVLVWTPMTANAADGKKIYTAKCLPCHGDKGDGKGPMAVIFSPPPGNFGDPKFWEGNVDEKINTSVTKGKGKMVPIDMEPDDIKAVSAYIKSSFKK